MFLVLKEVSSVQAWGFGFADKWYFVVYDSKHTIMDRLLRSIGLALDLGIEY